MKTRYTAGRYQLTRDNGDTLFLTLTASEARMLFKLYDALGFSAIELTQSEIGGQP